METNTNFLLGGMGDCLKLIQQASDSFSKTSRSDEAIFYKTLSCNSAVFDDASKWAKCIDQALRKVNNDQSSFLQEHKLLYETMTTHLINVDKEMRQQCEHIRTEHNRDRFSSQETLEKIQAKLENLTSQAASISAKSNEMVFISEAIEKLNYKSEKMHEKIRTLERSDQHSETLSKLAHLEATFKALQNQNEENKQRVSNQERELVKQERNAESRFDYLHSLLKEQQDNSKQMEQSNEILIKELLGLIKQADLEMQSWKASVNCKFQAAVSVNQLLTKKLHDSEQRLFVLENFVHEHFAELEQKYAAKDLFARKSAASLNDFLSLVAKYVKSANIERDDKLAKAAVAESRDSSNRSVCNHCRFPSSESNVSQRHIKYKEK